MQAIPFFFHSCDCWYDKNDADFIVTRNLIHRLGGAIEVIPSLIDAGTSVNIRFEFEYYNQ
jgi:hypothetical protein